MSARTAESLRVWKTKTVIVIKNKQGKLGGPPCS